MLTNNIFSKHFCFLLYLYIVSKNIVLSSPPSKDCKCGSIFNDEEIATRVVGGGQTKERDHPFLVLLLAWDTFICGGTIISPTFVLTAGHCTSMPWTQMYKVALGVHNRVRWNAMNTHIYPVLEIRRHEKYVTLENNVLVNDIALIKINTIEFSNIVQPICLPINIDVSSYKAASIIGWGTTSLPLEYPAMIPRQALISMISFRDYRQTLMYEILEASNVPDIHKKVLYGYKRNVDVCMGDSGGPLYVIDQNSVAYLIGVVSMGIGCGNSDGIPGIYTSVQHYLDWILQNIESPVCSPK